MTDTNTKSKLPTHSVFHVNGEGKSARWTKIGAGWAHADGKGIQVRLDVTPADKRFTIRVANDKKN